MHLTDIPAAPYNRDRALKEYRPVFTALAITEDAPMEPTAKRSVIPPDDPNRELAIARPETDETLPHVCVVGDTYTILVSGKQTNQRYSLIDMLVADEGGPPPHRHDFEELFVLLDGEIEFTFRGDKHVVHAGESINIPANAPHNFKNVSGRTARMLCMCTPAGQEEFFLLIGDRVPTRTSPPPEVSAAEQERRKRLLFELIPNG
jgi:quercetin dioxygenase-like cupin family protein